MLRFLAIWVEIILVLYNSVFLQVLEYTVLHIKGIFIALSKQVFMSSPMLLPSTLVQGHLLLG